MVSSNPDNASTKESQAETNKKNVSFDIYGNIVDEQKAKIKARSLSLAKSHVGLTYDDWRHVPTALKNDMWNSLSKEFGLQPVYKENIMSQASVQWKAWKKNIRTHHFGKTRQEVMEWKDKVPPGETVPLAEWNIFVEREATLKKLEQRAKARENRAKKKDVHLLGSKSYAQVTTEWTERTTGTKDQGLEPNRVNVYIHSRRNKTTGEFHPNFVDTAAKITEIRSTQGESSEADIDNDALTQVIGKDKRGRTRGLGTNVSKTKFKAVQPLKSKMQQMENDVKDNKEMLSTIIELLRGQNARNSTCPSPGTSHSVVAKTSMPTQASSSLPRLLENAGPIKAHKGYYQVRDIKDEKDIAMAKIEAIDPGTLVHCRPLVAPEVKLNIISVYPKMMNEPVYLEKQGGNTLIGEFEGSYIAWPLYLLKEI